VNPELDVPQFNVIVRLNLFLECKYKNNMKNVLFGDPFIGKETQLLSGTELEEKEVNNENDYNNNDE